MWGVYCDGKFIGIKESNYEWASEYWNKRSKIRGMRFILVWENLDG